MELAKMELEKANPTKYNDGIGTDVLIAKITIPSGEEKGVRIPHQVKEISYTMDVESEGSEGSVFLTNEPTADIEADLVPAKNWQENVEGPITTNLFGGSISGMTAVKCKSVSGIITLTVREGRTDNN